MIKELKYFFFIFVIIIFFFFVLKYYFSDTNIKKSHRSVNLINDNINQYEDNLLILNSDTENIIEYVEMNNKKENKYFFLELLKVND
tara:strand:- start:389 stop:649 length:261 start_codon:yes stop_codon:yes gene_type:complete